MKLDISRYLILKCKKNSNIRKPIKTLKPQIANLLYRRTLIKF